ncbi:MAG: hypothetical protein LAT58_13235, partial [Opitutales bacterium]|nr:hypothetical protein [Opitutales bacterium]
YRMLLLGQAGGDGAKEEMAQILRERYLGDDADGKSGRWRLWRALTEGIVVGSRLFVEPFKNFFSSGPDKDPLEIYDGLVSAKRKFRRRGFF